jgi:hypothetical protein
MDSDGRFGLNKFLGIGGMNIRYRHIYRFFEDDHRELQNCL